METRVDKVVGGRAFPRTPCVDSTEVGADCDQRGMTLRDWFAGQVANGLFSRADFMAENEAGVPEFIKNGAETAYAIADAMLKAREL